MTTNKTDPREQALEQLRRPFAPDEIEKLPKVLNRNDNNKERCQRGSRVSADGHFCGGWHARAMHLDYVGHAGITDRLNEVDPEWDYEFMHVELSPWTEDAVAKLYESGTPEALTEARRLVRAHGRPLSRDGGCWIRLTVLGVTRMGFGDAAGKSGPNATKEVIGDALRNAAMRFGVGTYLWSKSEAAYAKRLGVEDPDDAPEQQTPSETAVPRPAEPDSPAGEPEPEPEGMVEKFNRSLANARGNRKSLEALRKWALGANYPDGAIDAINEAINELEPPNEQ